jgi:hypothetical protein
MRLGDANYVIPEVGNVLVGQSVGGVVESDVSSSSRSPNQEAKCVLPCDDGSDGHGPSSKRDPRSPGPRYVAAQSVVSIEPYSHVVDLHDAQWEE